MSEVITENSSNSSSEKTGLGKEKDQSKPKQEPSYQHFCFRFTRNKVDDFSSGYVSIMNALKLLKVRCAIFQLEKGSNGGIEHYQGYFELEKDTKKRVQPIRDFFCNEFYPELKFPLCDYLEHAKSVPGSMRYCMKEETRIDGPWSIGSIHLTSGRKKLHPLEHKWQTDCFDYLRDNEPDHRTIIYINKEYGAGKSLLCRHIYRKLGGVVVDGHERHILDVVKNTDKSIYLYNDVADGKRIPWNALEKVKDGFFCGHFGTKGTGMFELTCMHPHLVVFSNREFDDAISHSNIDRDRFIFF